MEDPGAEVWLFHVPASVRRWGLRGCTYISEISSICAGGRHGQETFIRAETSGLLLQLKRVMRALNVYCPGTTYWRDNGTVM